MPQCADVSFLGVEATRRDPFPNFRPDFQVFASETGFELVFRGCFPFTPNRAILPRLSGTLRSLCGPIFRILRLYGLISRAGLWSPIFNIRDLAAETRFEVA